jgi:hypothetical protein
MADVEITIGLPAELLVQAKLVGIDIESVRPDLIAVIQKRIERKQAWQNLINTADQLRGSLTQKEVEAELAAAKAERIAHDQAK